jgi:anaerobic selenocysteine-containing dehydrogenase
MDVVNTICQSCYFYCGLRVHREGDRIVRIEGLPEHPVNRGTICAKGLAAQQLVTDPKRLTHPMRRVGARGAGGWEPITWDEALEWMAHELKTASEDVGPESVVYHRGHAPGWVTTMNYVTRFMNAFGSPNLLTHAHLCFAPRAIAHASTYGGVPEPDFDGADCILLWGFNPAYTSVTNYARRIVDAKARGAKLVVVDPRFTPTAAKADLWLRPKPSTDVALAMGIIKVLIEEGLYDEAFIRESTIGFNELSEHVRTIELERISAITGVPIESIQRAARVIGGGGTTVVKEGNGLDQHVNVVQAVRGVALITALLGSINVPGGGVLLPPLPFADVQLRDARGSDWEERSLSTHPLYYRTGNSLHDEELFSALESGAPYPIRALFVQGGSLVAANSNTERTLRLLDRVGFIAVHDLYPTATSKVADLVLPAASFLERDLLLYYRYRPSAQMNMIALQQRVVPPVGESRSDLEVLFALAKRLGMDEQFPWQTVEEAFEWELEPVGITLEYLRQHPEGYQRMYAPEELYRTSGRTGFATASGKVELVADRLATFGYASLPEPEPMPEPLQSSEAYPFLCGTGLKLGIHTHTEFRTLPWIEDLEPAPFIEIHPAAAKRLGIADKDEVRVTSPWGSVTARARLSEGLAEDTVMLAYGYGQPYANGGWTSVNDITPDGSIAADPISGATSNRRVPVRIEPITGDRAEAERIRRFLVEDMDRCVGCHTCEVACRQEHGESRVRMVTVGPTEGRNETTCMVQIVLGTGTCDLCADRAAEGLAPACVRACPTRALAAVSEKSAIRLLQGGRHHLCASAWTGGTQNARQERG